MYGTTSWLVTGPVSAHEAGGFSEGPPSELCLWPRGTAPRGERREPGRIGDVGWLMIALLVGAVAAVIGAEWPRLSARFGNEARERRERARRKSQLKLLRTETEEFAASVERDLDQLPTIEETDRKR
jgi:hypothetical protein